MFCINYDYLTYIYNYDYFHTQASFSLRIIEYSKSVSLNLITE